MESEAYIGWQTNKILKYFHNSCLAVRKPKTISDYLKESVIKELPNDHNNGVYKL